ncbi:NUD14-like protein [Mya arenaria]|uniref:NUD14-like protein n=2 Tax=Mya arenaria TaxID=6604 RepID=A0ABY7FC79_MYAAR|nr:NUD14-like protein [Mya arenaria]
MKVSSGGGNANEGEMIDVVEIPAQEGRKFAMDESINKPVGVLFGVMWFYDNVYDRKVKGTKRKDTE